MGIRVVSKRPGGTQPVAGETLVYIGRPSIFGNPFPLADESERDAVIAQYRVWLRAQYLSNAPFKTALLALAARARAGEDLALQCWCAPCASHGDVLASVIAAINRLPEAERR